MASFRSCEKYLLHIKPFVVNNSAISPFLGGAVERSRIWFVGFFGLLCRHTAGWFFLGFGLLCHHTASDYIG